VFCCWQVKDEVKNEDLNMQYFIDVQGLRGEGWNLRNLTKIDVSVDEICAIFGPHFDKNGWKYKLQINKEFQGVIKSL
jgi:hypothetical protein